MCFNFVFVSDLSKVRFSFRGRGWVGGVGGLVGRLFGKIFDVLQLVNHKGSYQGQNDMEGCFIEWCFVEGCFIEGCFVEG